MPELPEVETTRRGIEPHLLHHTIRKVIVRDARLRWPVPSDLPRHLQGQRIIAVDRRGKYLLIATATGTLIIHLGMSGSLRIVSTEAPVKKHDHVDIVLDTGHSLRLHDPRRFGCVLFTSEPVNEHVLLKELGVEPLLRSFSGDYLWQQAQRRKIAVKLFIMDSHVVVGVGNIYASEALFLAGIHPKQPTHKLSRNEYQKLVAAIKQVLRASIKQGGTTLRDFVNSEGNPGYFSNKLRVYGRDGEPCTRCSTHIKHFVLGQRSTYFCPHCQIRK